MTLRTEQSSDERPDEDDGPPDGQRGPLPHRRLILAAGVVVVLGAVATWLIAFSSVFGVGTVTVRGAHTLTPAQIAAAAKVDKGTPLVRLDTAAIAHRIEALPDVATAQVQTSFPSTLLITVTERVAIGVVRSGNDYRLVDSSGDQFRTVSAKPAALPLFVVPAGTSSKTTGGAVATVAAALSPALRAKVASIQALDPTAITLLLVDHRVVRWGSSAQSTTKARILPTLLAQSGSQFNLTNPARPYAR